VKTSRKLWQQFDKGLFIVGGREAVPDGSLRRAGAVHPLRTMSLRSRFGCQLLQTSTPANSCVAFGLTALTEHHYYGTFQGLLLRDTAIIDTGYTPGNKLSFVKQAPQLQDPDYLFISNGGKMRKTDTNGNVTNWGIAAPLTGPTLALGPQEKLEIDNLDTDAASWNVTNGSATVTNDASFFEEGTGSLKIAIGANIYNVTVKSTVSWDLTQFAAAVWVANTAYTANGTEPWQGSRIHDVNGNVQVCTTSGTSAMAGPPTFATVYGQTTHDNTVVWTNFGPNVSSTSDFISFWTATSNVANTYEISIEFAGPGGSFYFGNAPTTVPPNQFSWNNITVAKSSFKISGSPNWNNITSIKIQIAVQTNGATVWIDDIEMQGGVGMSGTYQGAVVFANTVTGSVSNPQPLVNNAYSTVANLIRQPLIWSNIPISTDPQVNARILYRSLGNQTTLFFDQVISDNTTTTIVDTVADFFGANGGNEPAVLGSNSGNYPAQLQTDNTPPPADGGLVAGPYQGSLFFTRASFPSRLYYTAIGRPESTENFIELSYADDSLQGLFIFNGSLYVLGAKHGYVVQQVATSPLLYTFYQVTGMPGTVSGFSIVVGKNGVAWQAPEGMVLFNGFLTTAIDLPIELLFRGESSEDYTPLVVNYGIYTKGEFWFSDGLTNTFALHEDTRAWRALGIATASLCYDETLEQAHGNLAGSIVYFEVPGFFTDNGVAIPFEAQCGGTLLAEDISTTVSRLVFDLNTNGQTVTVTVLVNDADLLPKWAASTAYAIGTKIQDSNGNVQVSGGGTSGSPKAPVWSTTIGSSTTDNTVTWTLVGPGVFTLPPLVTTSRQRLEFTPRFAAQALSFRFTAALTTGLVEVFAVEALLGSGS